MLIFDSKKLNDIMWKVLQKAEVNEESIRHVTASLIQTSLRGVDSHGINLFPHYCKVISTARINRAPEFKIKTPAPAAMIVDADHGFGHHAGHFAMIKAVELARKNGIGAVSVKNSTHFGAAAYYGLAAAELDCIGLAFTNADSLAKAHVSKEAYFGTNPICFTAPMLGEQPFCLDMATTQVSFNKIKNYRRNSEPLPDDWGYDSEGVITRDPFKVKTLAPIGSYKGYGLSMMVEILCGLLAGGPFGRDLLAMYVELDKKRFISHFFCAIDISKFRETEQFKAELKRMADYLRSMPRLDETQEVKIAGDPEKQCFQTRLLRGIPVDESIYAEFIKLTPEFEEAVVKK